MKKKLLNFIAFSLVVLCCITFKVNAESRGKLHADVEYTGEDITQVTISCKYSLFIKECYVNMEDIIIE